LTFWNWRRAAGAPATQGSAAMAVSTELAPIELYTADARIVGWIAPHGHRVTDLLNSQDEIRLWRPSPGPLDATDAPVHATQSPHLATPYDDSGEWQSLHTASVILAMPPEWRASRQLRLHRRLRRVAVAAGSFSITGNVHVPSSGEIGPQLLRRRTFLPLTDAYLLHRGEPPFEHVVSVVIVNTAHVDQIVPLVSLA
jgi:hypothetical protein